jgi:hypothetical protein
MARALIVGCGCRGRELAASLLASGWQVRGTTRGEAQGAAIAAAGAEAVTADPSRVGTILEKVGDVTVLVWLLGSAEGDPDAVRALHEERLESLMRGLVDTPVRGFVYERGGSVPQAHLDRGERIVRDAAARWRIPVELPAADPGDRHRWRQALEAAVGRLGGSG